MHSPLSYLEPPSVSGGKLEMPTWQVSGVHSLSPLSKARCFPWHVLFNHFGGAKNSRDSILPSLVHSRVSISVWLYGYCQLIIMGMKAGFTNLCLVLKYHRCSEYARKICFFNKNRRKKEKKSVALKNIHPFDLKWDKRHKIIKNLNKICCWTPIIVLNNQNSLLLWRKEWNCGHKFNVTLNE